MENAALIHVPRGRFPDALCSPVFRFLSLPLEIRNIIYEYAIFSENNPEFFVVNPKIELSVLQVSRAVSREASVILYTRRVAVIAFLPHQYYLHGRIKPITQLFRPQIEANKITSYRREDKPEPISSGHIDPHILVKFSRLRLCLFFPATFQTAYPLMFFDPIAELKSVLGVLKDKHSSSSEITSARGILEIIVAVYPRPDDEEIETPREARVGEDFVRRGITDDLKAIRAKRVLKVGGNFTKEGLVKFCKVTCGP